MTKSLKISGIYSSISSTGTPYSRAQQHAREQFGAYTQKCALHFHCDLFDHHSPCHSAPIYKHLSKNLNYGRNGIATIDANPFYLYFFVVCVCFSPVLLGIIRCIIVIGGQARPPILLFDFVILIIKLDFVFVIYSLQIFMCLNSTDGLF